MATDQIIIIIAITLYSTTVNRFQDSQPFGGNVRDFADGMLSPEEPY